MFGMGMIIKIWVEEESDLKEHISVLKAGPAFLCMKRRS